MARFKLGDDASPDEIRAFVEHRGGRHYLRTLQDEETGKWVSPINGQEFDTYYQMTGHIGARMRHTPTSELTEDRSGYIKAIRRGERPTGAQQRAHREYMREFRKRRRLKAKEAESETK